MKTIEQIVNYQEAQLPDTLEDLTQFVLVTKAKLQAYMLKLQTVNKLSTAQEIRDQTLKEAQEISTALIAAEQRIGELLLAIPKASGGDRKSEDFKNPDSGNFEKTKSETIKEMGYGKNEASDYQRMAKNPEVVQKVIEEALANGEVVTKSQVMKEIKAEQDRLKAEMKDLKEERDYLQFQLEEEQKKEPKVKEVIKEVVPDDYEELKQKAKLSDDYRQESKDMRKQYKEMAEKWKKAESEKESLLAEKNLPEAQKAKEVKESALFFCAGISNFIQRYGGYVWLTKELNNMEASEREGFISGINAIEAWVFQMKENMKGDTE